MIVIIKNNIFFSVIFGAGSKYTHGEDSLFLRDALRKNLKIYTYPVSFASQDNTSSTWFTGHDEKYFFDKGAVLTALFPYFKHAAALYLALKFSVRCRKNFVWIYKSIRNGMAAYKNSMDYKAWKAS